MAEWLQQDFDVPLFRQLLPEADGFEVERYALPNLRALNFMVRGILGWGVASNLRLDTQAKGLAELIRSRHRGRARLLRAAGQAGCSLGLGSSHLVVSATAPTAPSPRHRLEMAG